MNDADALALLRAAVPSAEGETWADLGAGTGVFTRALATLAGPAGRVFAVDADDRARDAVREWAARAGAVAPVSVIRGDVTRPLGLPALDGV
ncbi:MAG TPA: class I SAM-dependent methyltransferase, partial [Longimicrobium sp.]|nr:class I SAM-dependent methyltransferase [Longimicrobium sp.]